MGVVHNTPLGIFADNGLLGFIPFMAILWLAWSDYSRSFLLSQRMRRFRDQSIEWAQVRSVVLQAALMGCLIQSQFHPVDRHKGLWLLVVLSTALWRVTRARAVELSSQSELEESESTPMLTPAPSLGFHGR